MNFSWILPALFIFPLLATGQEPQNSSSIRGYYVGTCSSWVMLRGTNGLPGWACGTMPATIAVPEGHDVANELRQASIKIADLESRLSALETKCNVQ